MFSISHTTTHGRIITIHQLWHREWDSFHLLHFTLRNLMSLLALKLKMTHRSCCLLLDQSGIRQRWLSSCCGRLQACDPSNTSRRSARCTWGHRRWRWFYIGEPFQGSQLCGPSPTCPLWEASSNDLDALSSGALAAPFLVTWCGQLCWCDWIGASAKESVIFTSCGYFHILKITLSVENNVIVRI